MLFPFGLLTAICCHFPRKTSELCHTLPNGLLQWCCATTLSQECIAVSTEHCIHSSAFVEGKTPSRNSKYYCIYLSMFAMAMDMFSKECPPFPQQFQSFRLQILSFPVFGLSGKVYGKNNASRDVSLDWHLMTNLSGQTRSWKTQKLKPGGESDWVPFPQTYIQTYIYMHTCMHTYINKYIS